MDVLSINQKIYIRRSDGRIHLARIVKLDGSNKPIVTVEWHEGELTRGKEMALDTVIQLNPQIYGTSCTTRALAAVKSATAQINASVSIAPRPAANNPQHFPLTVNGFVAPRLVAGNNAHSAVVTATPRQPIVAIPQDEIVLQIERLRVQRERRHQLNAQARVQRQWCKNSFPGNPNWEIARMLCLHRLQMDIQSVESCGHRSPTKQHQILVCVRKRPLNQREQSAHELDVITVPNRELLVVHEPRKQVNLTKFLEHHHFRFDHTFDESCTNAQVYEQAARPLVQHVFEGGMATCFAYGQTGSGKTHTMGGEFTGKQNGRDGIYALATRDVFAHLESPNYAELGLKISCSFFELYGSRVYDLLVAGKPQLRVLEDGQQHVQVVGLTEEPVDSTDAVLALLELGNSVRTSGQTSANSKSSRSHAVFQIVLRTTIENQLHGKFSLIDLAGNERGADNCSANRLTRLEGAEINKSLLALKECIRALGRQSTHLPFRGSKLTQVLRDSFIGGKKVKTCMIATISPGLRSVEHTLNTLRYADRVKELTPHRHAKETSRPAAESDLLALAQSSSLPDIVQEANQLDRVSSSASLPDANDLGSMWNDFSSSRALEDDNLAYFNQATDNYVQPLESTANVEKS